MRRVRSAASVRRIRWRFAGCLQPAARARWSRRRRADAVRTSRATTDRGSTSPPIAACSRSPWTATTGAVLRITGRTWQQHTGRGRLRILPNGNRASSASRQALLVTTPAGRPRDVRSAHQGRGESDTVPVKALSLEGDGQSSGGGGAPSLAWLAVLMQPIAAPEPVSTTCRRTAALEAAARAADRRAHHHHEGSRSDPARRVGHPQPHRRDRQARVAGRSAALAPSRIGQAIIPAWSSSFPHVAAARVSSDGCVAIPCNLAYGVTTTRDPPTSRRCCLATWSIAGDAGPGSLLPTRVFADLARQPRRRLQAQAIQEPQDNRSSVLAGDRGPQWIIEAARNMDHRDDRGSLDLSYLRTWLTAIRP